MSSNCMQQAGSRSLARGSEKRGAVWNETKKKRLPNGNRRGAQQVSRICSLVLFERAETKNGKTLLQGSWMWLSRLSLTLVVCPQQPAGLAIRRCCVQLPICAGGPAFIRFDCEHIVAVQDGWAPHWFRSLVRHRCHGKQASEKKEPGSYLGELLIHAPFLCSSRERGATVDDQVLSERLPCLRESPRLRLAQPLCECRPWCADLPVVPWVRGTARVQDYQVGRVLRAQQRPKEENSRIGRGRRGVALQSFRRPIRLSFPNRPRVHTRGRSVSVTGLAD